MTTCRICESACGLIATVDPSTDTVLSLRPDPDHPISAGYACVKGTRFADAVQHHPDRLLQPRLGGRPCGWDEALAQIGGELRRIIEAHGPDAIGLYSGNAAGHALGSVLGLSALQRAIGTSKHYSCLTLDNSEVFVVAEAVFGTPFATFVSDPAGSDLVVLFGTDPLASQASAAQSHPQAAAQLRERARRGQLIVVDPRRSITAARARHLQPRVGTDVFLLGWLLRRVLPRSALSEPDRRALTQATEPLDRGRTARITGLPEDQLEALLSALVEAERPLVWSGLGVLLGPAGTLGWWLTVCLQAALGGLDREGGWRWQPGPIDLPRWARRLGVRGHDPSVRSVGGWPAILDTLPAATLADDVLSERPDRLRALIVIGGDPASALPHTTRAGQALDALELLVSVDLFVNETGRRAHAILPAATWLERDSTGLHTSNQRPSPHLRLDRRVVQPRGSARTDWRICLELCRAVGRPALGSHAADLLIRAGLGPVQIARAATTLARIPWRAVRQGTIRPGRSPMPPGRFAVPRWCEALARLPDPQPTLRLLTSVRSTANMNHWLRPDAQIVARIHPDDGHPGPGIVEGPGGALRVEVVTDPTLAPGTLVIPFGDASINPNALIGTDALEPFTGQPISNGAPVTLRPDPGGGVLC